MDRALRAYLMERALSAPDQVRQALDLVRECLELLGEIEGLDPATPAPALAAPRRGGNPWTPAEVDRLLALVAAETAATGCRPYKAIVKVAPLLGRPLQATERQYYQARKARAGANGAADKAHD